VHIVLHSFLKLGRKVSSCLQGRQAFGGAPRGCVKGSWEDRFEQSYGFWRGFVDEVVLAFQACGDFEGGFARVYCDECRAEYLVAFSCSRRGICTSCAAKRGAIFGALLGKEIVEEVGHCLWTFTVPKLLRPYFCNRRALLGKLRHAGWETVRDLIAEVTDKEVRPGMVAAIHTSSSDLRWNRCSHYLALPTPLFSANNVC